MAELEECEAARSGDPGGLVYDLVYEQLSGYDWFRSYLAADMPVEAYLETLLRHEPELLGGRLNADKLHVTTRWSRDDRANVDGWLAQLHRAGLLPATELDHAAYEAMAADINARFDHGGYRTYIFPEEARLLHAIVKGLRSRRMLFLGSYYGYWAIWAAAASLPDARLTLIDPDPAVCALAERNFKTLGFADKVDIHNCDGESFLAGAQGGYDLLVLDAEGPEDHPDPEYRGKAIYNPLFRAALPYLAADARVVVHNILVNHGLDDPYFAWKTRKNRGELDRFLKLTHEHMSKAQVLETSEGVGVYG